MGQAKTGLQPSGTEPTTRVGGSLEDVSESLVTTGLRSTSFSHQQHPDVSSGETLPPQHTRTFRWERSTFT